MLTRERVRTASTAAKPLPAVNLPKGGGAIRGMGEKFDVSPVTGSASLSIPIVSTPGRSGFGPQLFLNYSSGAGNGPFGFGWDLSAPSIARKTDKGLPRYHDEAESDVYLISGQEDLVPVLDATGKPASIPRTLHGVAYSVRPYRPRIEGAFLRIERWTESATGAIHWRAISRDNVTTIFGPDDRSQIADPVDPRRVFSWLTQVTFDKRGNISLYEYLREDSRRIDAASPYEANRTDKTRSAQQYLKSIRYGNATPWFADWSAAGAQTPLPAVWRFQIVFDYGDHDPDRPTPTADRVWPSRPDPFSTYRAGFEVRTYRRCRRVLMFHNFPDEPAVKGDCLVRSTDFVYSDETAPADPRNPIYTFLESATHTGYRRTDAGYDRSSTPPLEFFYSQAEVHSEIQTLDDADSRDNLPEGIDGGRFQFVDLDGEGLSGILTEQNGGWSYKRNLSPLNTVLVAGERVARAAFGPQERVATLPVPAHLGGTQQLMDLTGGGRLDLAEFDGPVPGYFERTSDEDWQPLKAFPSLPRLEWRDPNLRFIDVTGDGRADVLITEDDVYTFYPSLGADGFGEAERIYTPFDEAAGPRVVFADGTETVTLADMCGDGLRDIVRVRNGEVCYWPNLGYGRFGAKVTMDGSPRFTDEEAFDPRRIHLADIDGSGTSDLVYIGPNGVLVCLNRSGNSFAEPHVLAVFPGVDSLSSVQVLDLLGNGTTCLVWSSPLPGEAATPLRYVDLMGSKKPHLLVRHRNNLGAETRISYSPSTRFYLEDRRAGRPWVTRLPFPVQVVDRIDTYDWIGRSRFVSRYSYHHGYFDGEEREFRGFGMVEQRDTDEHRDDTLFPDVETVNEDAASFSPPVVTKTWFHTGAFFDAGTVSKQYEHEYWLEPAMRGDSPAAVAKRAAELLPDTVVEPGLSPHEMREAWRALKGSVLRVEVYSEDGSERAGNPYTITEQNYTVRCLQPVGPNRFGVFFVHPREAIRYQYERRTSDPRISHEFTLETDDFGDILRSISIGYGREPGYPEPEPDLSPAFRAMLKHDQERPHVAAAQRSYTGSIHAPSDLTAFDDYLAPQAVESITAELTGFTPAGRLFRFEEVDARYVAMWAGANDIAYEDVSIADIEGAAPAPAGRRIVERSRTVYRRDDLTDLLPLGTVEPLALEGDTFHLALTPALVKRVFGARVNDAILTEGGYVHPGGDPGWWIPSGRVYYSPGAADTPAQELATARAGFFMPRRAVDPFGAVSRVDYDDYHLLPHSASDALGNTTTVTTDYRVMEGTRIADANGNFDEVRFDLLGRLAGTAVSGKAGEGDSLAGFIPDVTDAQLLAVRNTPFTGAAALLGSATSRVVYDLFAYFRTRDNAAPDPPMVYTLSRETHAADGPGRLNHSYTYSDGFGREAQVKVQAEPGPVPGAAGMVDPRWIGTGWNVYDNKGRPVRKYEPFFTTTQVFEFNRQEGVSDVTFYDPTDRVVATLHPDNTFDKNIFDPWRQETWDANDTVLIADPRADADVGDCFKRLLGAGVFTSWRDARIGGAHGATPEERAGNQDAAQKASVHAATPAVIHFDSLGRACLSVAHNGADAGGNLQRYPTRTAVDPENQPLAVFDALGRHVMEHCLRESDGAGGFRYVAGYDLAGNVLYRNSMDAGERRSLKNVLGDPLRGWDARGATFRFRYDALHRLTHHFVKPAAQPEILLERFVYGEKHPDAALNLKTKLFRHYDPGGVAENARFDFKGNVIEAVRQLAVTYAATPDWSPITDIDEEPVLDVAALDAAAAPLLVTADAFRSATRFDALNRPIQVIMPHRADGRPSVVQPTYNAARLIERVDVWIRQAAVPAALLDPAGADLAAVNNIDYDARGRRVRCDMGNGAQTVYTYDPQTFRLVNLTTTRPDANPDARTLQQLDYTHDPVGNITRIRDSADIHNVVFFRNQRVEPSTDYTYDPMYRLIRSTGREHLGQNGGVLNVPQQIANDDGPRTGLLSPGDGNAVANYVERYVYDPVGNILQMIHELASGAWTRRYSYLEASAVTPSEHSNRLSATSVPGDNPAGPYSDSCQYDAHGNVTRMPHLPVMTWDALDRLQSTARQVANGGPPETTWYASDGSGGRIRKVTERQATRTRKSERIYLGEFEVYREYAADGTTVTLERETLHVMDDRYRVALVESRTSGVDAGPARRVRYQCVNHQMSSILEIGESAEVLSYEEFFPYGSSSYEAVASATEVPKRYRYTGKERDTENDFYYHGARYYAPWLGRWTAADPAGLGGSSNLYAYCRNSPVLFRDPEGTNEQTDTPVHATGFAAALLNLYNVVAPPMRRYALKLNVDEIKAVSQGGSWSDPGNKQFLDWMTNQATKGGFTPTHTIPQRPQISLAEELEKGPEAFRKAAAELMTRRFSEVKELENITNKARTAMRNLKRPERDLADALNRAVRGRIARAASEDAKLVSKALKEAGFDPKTLTALKQETVATKAVAETAEVAKTAGTVAKVVTKVAPTIAKASKVLSPVAKVAGKAATPIAFAGAAVQFATAKTTDDYIDASMSATSATLMTIPHPVAKAAGAGIAGGQLIESTLNVSDYSSAIGMKADQAVAKLGGPEGLRTAAGVTATILSTPGSISIALVDKVSGGRFARWVGLK